MSSKIEKQFICVLNTHHDCSYRRSYARGCDLRVVDEFATATCPHRLEATVLAAAEKEESPVSDIQQTNGGSEDSAQIAADTLDLKDIF